MSKERSLLDLPEALEEDILVRLPIKLIFSCESVCKRWYSLFHCSAFTESYFGSGHHQVSIPTQKDLRLTYPELRRRGRRRRRGRTTLMWAIGPSSNGICSLISIGKDTYRNKSFLHTLKIALFNPATRQLKFAAPFPDEYLPMLTGISSHKNFVSCGIDDDYRVVVLIEYICGNPQRRIGLYRYCFLAFLYTWRTGEWELLVDYSPGRRQFGIPPGTNVFESIEVLMEDMTACPQKLLNGCWHWLTEEYDEDDVENYGLHFTVLCFDFERKSFGLISGPPCKDVLCADVFVLQDHLALILLPDFGTNIPLQIWMKTKDPETIWTNIFSVNPITDLTGAIFYGVDYYPVQEEAELIRIKSITMLFVNKLITFDDKGGYQAAEAKEDSDQIPLSLAGISTFRPTLERLPSSTQAAEAEEDSDQIPLSLAGMSTFRPTLERLPGSTQCTVDYAKSLPVWKSDSVVKSFEQIREIPFVFKHAMLLVSKSELVLASMACLGAGFSRNLFVGWATDPKILIPFTERGQFGALACMLQPDPATPKVAKATISRRIPLVGQELADSADLVDVESHETRGLSVGARRHGGAYRDDLIDGFAAVHMFPFYDSPADSVIMEGNMDQPFIQVQMKCFSVYMDFEGRSDGRSTVLPLKLGLHLDR